MKTYTTDEIEAALCVYDWLVTEQMRTDKAEELTTVISDLWDDNGSPGMRCLSVAAGCIVAAVYDHMEKHGMRFDAPFDFEFVPAVCKVIDWDALDDDIQLNRGSYRPNVRDLWDAATLHLDADDITDVIAEFWDAARRMSLKMWGFDMVEEHREELEASRVAGDVAFRAVLDLGNRYALTRIDTGERA